MNKETGEQKFKRLAEKRTNSILHTLRLLGNLSSPNYKWDKKDVNKIFKEIEDCAGIAKLRFNKGAFTKFSLDVGVSQASGSKGIARRVSSKEAKPIHLPAKKLTINRCNNCFENRPTQAYRGLELCKRDFRKRKLIYRVRKANGNKKSFIK